MTEVFANAAQSSLSAGVSAGATSLTVVSAGSFPGSGNFRILVDSELMLVTAVSGNTFTVARAAEAFAGVQGAVAHGNGATVTHVLTAAGLQGLLPPGMVMPYAGGSAPAGWLACDGSAVSRTTYAALFAAIGTAWGGGDGSTTFNLPDLRGRAVLGSGTGAQSVTVTRKNAPSNVFWTTPTLADCWLTGQRVTFSVSPGGSAPAGFADGGTYYVSRGDATTVMLCSSYANAVANSGTLYTSTGSGTFTLTLALSARALADRGGEEQHYLGYAEMPGHTHGLNGDSNGFDGGDPSSVLEGNGATDQLATFAAGQDVQHNNMMPYAVVSYLIKT